MAFDLEAVVNANPQAAAELEKMQSTIDTLHDLRRLGVAKGSDLRPYRPRSAVNEVRVPKAGKRSIQLTEPH